MPHGEGHADAVGAGSAAALPALLRRVSAARLLRASGLVWVLVAMCIVAALVSDAFLNPFNLVNVLRQVALFGIVAIGMTFVILTAGIDLSVGSIVAVVAVVAALMLDGGVPIPLVVLAALGIGVVLGGLNGLGITLGSLPPFIMTLGTMVMGRGFAMAVSGGHPIRFPAASAEFAWLGQGNLLGLPVAVWIMSCCATRRSGATCMRSAAIPRQRGWPASTCR
jgi:ribose transport system permease protein